MPYTPLCGNCKQAGHTAEECNGSRREGPRNNNGQSCNNDTSAKLVLVSSDYPINGQNNNCNVNYMGVMNELIQENNFKMEPIESNLNSTKGLVQNVERVITRSRVAKQKPDGAQPIILADVTSPIVLDEIVGSKPIEEPIVPIRPEEQNLSIPIKNNVQPQEPSQVSLPTDQTMPIVTPNLRETRTLNPIGNADYQEYNPAPTVFVHPLKDRM